MDTKDSLELTAKATVTEPALTETRKHATDHTERLISALAVEDSPTHSDVPI